MRHALRSAITPIVTLLGLDVARAARRQRDPHRDRSSTSPASAPRPFNAIKRSDLPMIQGITLFGAFFIVIFNLIVDIAYAYLDPRVRYQ